ncbi:hypothetical protein TNCV_3089031 [Trichonephila clavipes]|uniref:Uncharacterized protein n=1 Tax=Trichonephila clavipes TaxID=2585209 RepID=A0A8X6RLL6_TRICX|nr:hypothetical protein TNCV_3089031 [Trichonephila clavipes]
MTWCTPQFKIAAVYHTMVYFKESANYPVPQAMTRAEFFFKRRSLANAVRPRGWIKSADVKRKCNGKCVLVSVRSNISKSCTTTENDVSKNQSSADSAIRLPNRSILNSNTADITEYSVDAHQTTLY